MKDFFRFFICIFFSFLLFSQDVYASSFSGKVKLEPWTSIRSAYTVIPSVSSAPVNTLDAGKDYSKDQYITYYTWSGSDSVFFVVYDASTSRYVDPGYYSFSVRVTYSLTVSASKLDPISLDFSFGDVPDGLVLTHILTTSTKISSTSYRFDVTFNISGTFNLRPNGIGLSGTQTYSPSIPISFDLVSGSYASYLGGTVTSSANGPGTLTFTPSVSLASSVVSASLVSDFDSTDDILTDTNQTIKDQHQEEIDKANQTSSDITSSSGKLEGTLSAWEIFTMPFQLLKEFAQAISSDGNTGFTFPSFSMMGYEIWPSYTFDLSTVKSNFPVLYNGLHLVSGTIVVSGFVNYCWRKWSILMGDDLPEDSGSAGGG